jgi:hypothetical protein
MVEMLVTVTPGSATPEAPTPATATPATEPIPDMERTLVMTGTETLATIQDQTLLDSDLDPIPASAPLADMVPTR